MANELITQYPWDLEQVPVTWEAHGLTCHVLRGPVGSLCGYVKLPEDHPLYNVGYSEDMPAWLQAAWEKRQGEVVGGSMSPLRMFCLAFGSSPQAADVFSVHGGVTYSGFDNGKYKPEGFWWGFDCAHAGDFTPSSLSYGWAPSGEDVYRELLYVQAQTEGLALQFQQVKALKS